jgi:S-adenosylmethionine decarboxylase
MEIKALKNFKLYGFNNLTKTLSFNIYDVCYATTPEHRQQYIEYIDEQYNSDRLTEILTNVSNIIGANILNIAKQDYDPQGASVTILVSEGGVYNQHPHNPSNTESPGPKDVAHVPTSMVGHLDKSHITVHTYPESHPDRGISTFRADIDVSTCGHISPLKALNYLIHSFESDIITADYRVRGFTRDVNGKKFFIDHRINSIQNFISTDIKDRYQMIDVNIYQENVFHTKMLLKDFDLDNYLFGTVKSDLSPQDRRKIKQMLKKEMLEIFYAKNISKVK